MSEEGRTESITERTLRLIREEWEAPLLERIAERESRLREIKAWFDVMASKYTADGQFVPLGVEWPAVWYEQVECLLDGATK